MRMLLKNKQKESEERNLKFKKKKTWIQFKNPIKSEAKAKIQIKIFKNISIASTSFKIMHFLPKFLVENLKNNLFKITSLTP